MELECLEMRSEDQGRAKVIDTEWMPSVSDSKVEFFFQLFPGLDFA